MRLEIEDFVTLLGLLLVGLALYWGIGWPGVVGYAGAILAAGGYLVADRKRSKSEG
ncbi:MAG: hypothetical protein U0350_39910 [Caldilineaceae bacterium]